MRLFSKTTYVRVSIYIDPNQLKPYVIVAPTVSEIDISYAYTYDMIKRKYYS